MMPTLFTGDFIFVNKFTYGLRLPVVHTKILDLGSLKEATWWCSGCRPIPRSTTQRLVEGLVIRSPT